MFVTPFVGRRDAYEFLLTLTAYATPHRVDSYDAGPEWFERVDAATRAVDRDTIRGLTDGCEHVFVRLFGLGHDLPAPGSSDQLVDAISALEPAELRLTLLGYYSRRTRRRVPVETIAGAASGDPAAERAFVAGAADGPECARALAGILGEAPKPLQTAVVRALRGWNKTVFAEHLAAVGERLDAEVDRLRHRLQELPLDAFLTEATNGADVIPEPGTDSIEIFPHWVLRPWNVFWEHGTAQIIGVPISPVHASADPDEPPDRLVGLAKALGDERRLRILRRLTTGSYTLQELADFFDIPKTTLLHHLVILRSAGIVRVGTGTAGRYSLRAEVPLELQRLLDAYLPAVRRTGTDGDGRPRPGGR